MSRGNYKKPPKPVKINDLKALGKKMKAMGCPNCGKQGPHMVPPSMGDPGFFICMTDIEINEVFTKHREEMAAQKEIRDSILDVCYDGPTAAPVTDEISKEGTDGTAGFYF